MTARILVKLGLLTILPLALTAGAVLFLVTTITQANLEAGLERSLSEKARLTEVTLEGYPLADYQAIVTDLARRAKARVTIIERDGTVLADSEADPAQMENHADRPEFIDAIRYRSTAVSQRLSSTVGTEFLYVAVPMEGGGAVRLALPLAEVNALARDSRNSITKVILWIFIPVIVAITWSARRISAQLSGIVNMSKEIASGNFTSEVPLPKRGDLRELNDLAATLQTTAGELRSTFNQLQDERQNFAATVNGIGEGILVVDRRRRIVLYNPTIERMFPNEPLRNAASLDDWSDRTIREIFGDTLESGAVNSTAFTIYEPDQRSWRVSCAPIISRKGKVQAVAAVFHDITELQRLERIRRDFVMNVSHELRTPLAAITGYAETLLDGAIDDKAINKRFVRTLWRNAQRLGQLTADLMTLSQIEVGAREFEFQRESARRLIDQAVEGIRPVVERRTLRLVVEPVDSSISLECDANAMQQILSNLLDNATKYTPEGGEITVGVREAGHDLEFFVRDTGIGISDEHMPRLFERFYRVDNARSRELGGTGLGLAIVKHLVQAHNGAVWVRSRHGLGSTFWFSMPVVQAGSPPIQPMPEMRAPLPLQ